ncbi:MAG: hypothetical protein HZA54_13260, partial [Planctomycetes bacterium]|nr:hypothetical protein [Planctomycetota bacterium]
RGLPLDTRLDLIYGEGPSLWGLEPVLSSFGPASRCRTGNREHRGERTLCRAYLASFVAFLLERGGPTLLGALRAVTDGAGAGAAARAAGVDVAALEREWHAWLARRLGEAVEPVGPAGPATGSAEGGDAAGRTGK